MGFTGNSYVKTKDGNKSINTIGIGDEVICSDGTYKKVISVKKDNEDTLVFTLFFAGYFINVETSKDQLMSLDSLVRSADGIDATKSDIDKIQDCHFKTALEIKEILKQNKADEKEHSVIKITGINQYENEIKVAPFIIDIQESLNDEMYTLILEDDACYFVNGLLIK